MEQYLARIGNAYYEFDAETDEDAIAEMQKRFGDVSWKLNRVRPLNEECTLICEWPSPNTPNTPNPPNTTEPPRNEYDEAFEGRRP